MAEAAVATPQELQIQERQNQQEQERSRVHVLDPDFLLFALPFAILVDAIDIILELTAIFIIPKLIGIMLDLITFAIIGSWMYWRTGKIAKTKKRQQALLSTGRAAIRGPLRRVLIRGGATLFGELIPFVGIIPFWTIAVISTLRER